MTVASTKSSNLAASARLTKAINSAAQSDGASASAAREKTAASGSTAALVKPSTPSKPAAATRTAATDGAMRGAKAAPEPAGATGASEAANGNQNVMSVAPGANTTAAGSSSPYTPYAASMDAYAYGGGGGSGDTASAQQQVAPAGQGMEAGGTDASMAYEQAPAPTGSEVHGMGTEPIAGTGAWNADWQRRFEKLELAPADLAYLASAGFDDNTLFDIAMELEQVDLLDTTAPQPGIDAGSVASANGPTESAWSTAWEQKFTDVMQRMGMSQTEIAQQLQGVQGVPITEEQLNVAYEQMAGAIGAYDDAWKQKFETLLDELKTPAADKAQIMEQLAGSGLTEEQLQQAYTQMEAAKPAWNKDWESQFKALDVPDELLTQLKESGAPKEALEQQLQSLIDTKMKFKKDGRLEKLQDAKATNEEKWAVMTQDLEGKEFDKVVEQIRSSHVPAWKRVLSFGVNLIPGVYALQFVTGKDWVTGDKIDRTNPLNIVGAVASGFAGFTAVRGAIQGVQGLTAANAAFKAGTATAGLKNAATAANLLPKFQAGLKFTDYLKSAIPIVNRFGEAGRLSAVGRGYFQSMQLAAGTAALTSVSGGGSAVNAASKAQILDGLKQGKSIDAALKAAGATGQYADEAASAFKNYGFLQGGVGRFVNGSGNFTFNPFKNRTTIAAVEGVENVFSLGSKVNFATKGGLAQGIGAIRGAEYASKLAATGAASVATGGANIGAVRGAEYISQAKSINPMLGGGRTMANASGLNIADDVQRIATLDKTAMMAAELGVKGGKFRSLLQLGSNGQASRIASIMENGGSTAYRVGRHSIDTAQRFAGFAATPLIGGAALGMTGKQIQPAWEYWKNRDEIRAEESQYRADAEQEAAELERLYQEQQGQAGAGATTSASASTQQPTGAVATGTASAATAANPNQVYVDPATGYYVDPTTGMQADPATGQVYDTNGQLVGNLSQQVGG